MDEADRAAIWGVAALVAAREALADEIDGTVLRDFAVRLGADRLEMVLALPPGGRAPLPRPEQLVEAGQGLAEAALPRVLASYLGATAGDGDEEPVRVAERIVWQVPA